MSEPRVRVYFNNEVLNSRVFIGPDGIYIYENYGKEPATKKSQVESDVKAVNEKTVHPIKQEKPKSTLELPSTSQKSQLSSNQNQAKSTPARPPSAVPYDVPNFQNQDDVNLYIATLISENEALKSRVWPLPARGRPLPVWTLNQERFVPDCAKMAKCTRN